MSNKKYKKNKKNRLPDNCLMEVSGLSEDGDLMAVTVDPEDNLSFRQWKNQTGSCRGGSFYCAFVAEKRCVVGKTFGAD